MKKINTLLAVLSLTTLCGFSQTQTELLYRNMYLNSPTNESEKEAGQNMQPNEDEPIVLTSTYYCDEYELSKIFITAERPEYAVTNFIKAIIKAAEDIADAIAKKDAGINSFWNKPHRRPYFHRTIKKFETEIGELFRNPATDVASYQTEDVAKCAAKAFRQEIVAVTDGINTSDTKNEALKSILEAFKADLANVATNIDNGIQKYNIDIK